MDPGKKKAAHTNIIDFDEVAALTQQGQRKKPPKRKPGVSTAKRPRDAPRKSEVTKPSGSRTTTVKTSVKQTSRKSPKAPKSLTQQDTASSEQAKPTRKLAAGHQSGSRYFEASYPAFSLKIPLYDQDGKKRQHARLSATLCSRSRDELLELVEEYAGRDKRKQFVGENMTKKNIANWLEYAEQLALGANPVSKLGESRDEDNEDDGDGTTDPDPELANDSSQTQGKRKRSDPSSPAHKSSQTTKKQRTQGADQHTSHESTTDHAQSDTTPEVRKAGYSKARRADEDAQRLANLTAFMKDQNLLPDETRDVETTLIVHLPEANEDRILTASWQPKTSIHTGTLVPTLHDTPISLDPRQRRPPNLSTEPPFLKTGMHGRHGDFGNDPDRRTGRGHQVRHEDAVAYEKYLHTRGSVYARYPVYPHSHINDPIDPMTKETWRVNELVAAAFDVKYPGYAVNHLWPCGCEKLRTASSEAADSEEE
ncbi:hypothetical protein FB567DRAFT_628124 [Paraphoma chrysanthemicola]|uniref:Uncharacterized protein n=1 Tax=Paraphoma chrysanthemicola TaxID=798071 RepID=A0A8K0VZS6_9PLEO|nr:hypothetical protein FB567DRAFT_628124 [Paraphoma chrysanthemicola]